MHTPKLRSRGLAALVAGALLMSPAFATKPDDTGNPDKSNKQSGKAHAKKDNRGKASGAHAGGETSVSAETLFGDSQRDIVREYYDEQFKSGHCPPGLAKKHNGCLPPGQAKKWRIGRPLPDDVIYHDLPEELLRRLGEIPEGYELIRVGADILKIAVGTGLVIEAVEDLGRLY